MEKQTPIEELINLGNDSLYTMNKIEWWLMKQAENFEVAFEGEKFEFEGERDYLPLLLQLDRSENARFVFIYRALEELSEFYRYEEHTRKELKEFKKVKSNIESVRKWLIKNEEIGISELILFETLYLDYTETPHHLKVYLSQINDIEIYVNRKDFINIIKFNNIFNKLYFKKIF